MNQEIKLLLALNQIENITQLIHDNEYESYMISHLMPLHTEFKRQLTNLSNSTKLKE